MRDFLKVRGRDGKPCLVCGTTIRAVRVGDGDACFCPHCQRETRKLFVNWTRLNDAATREAAGTARQGVQKDRARPSPTFNESSARRHRDRDPAGRMPRGPPPTAPAPRRRATGEPRRRREARERRRRRHRRPRRRSDAVGAQALEIGGPGLRAHDGQTEHGAQRDADRLAVERIRAARRQHQRVRAERGGVARERAQVVDVGQILEHDDQRARAGGSGAGGRSLADRQAAAVNVKARRWRRGPAARRRTPETARRSASASVARRGGVTSTECTRSPLASSRRTTRSLSATNRPPSALRWRSLSCR